MASPSIALRNTSLDAAARGRSRWRPLLRNRGATVAFGVIALLILVAILAPLIAPYDPTETDATAVLVGPSLRNLDHPLGTDSLGRDILSRAVYGARISLIVGFAAVAVGLVLGATLGVLAGYIGGWTEDILMRIVDVLMAIPGIILALAILAAIGPTLHGVILAIGIAALPGDARLARSEALREKEQDYIAAARTIGSGHIRIVWRHLVPNIASILIVRATTNLGAAILTAAGLSFLGLGVPPPTPTWGGMVSEGRQYIFTAAYIGIIPGIFIMVTVLAFNVAGDGLRDALDPRSKLRGVE